MKTVSVAGLSIGNGRPLTVIAGPCQLESADHAQMIAGRMKEICDAAGAQYVFKASYDKANRTSLSGRRGLGMEAGLKILSDIRSGLGVPVLTDVHTAEQCAPAAQAVDILQIPAFLCRQTDLLLAAGETGAAINVKKGQFLAPWDMVNVVAKIESTGNDRILLTERGVSFGYNTLVADMRSLPIMARTGYPVVMDATHSVQQPGGQGGSSGGQREFAPVMARAAVAVGVAAVFIETHEAPDTAPSDGPNMIPLDRMDRLVETLMDFDRLAKADPIDL
ncbi:3-deoxy-8-phosphooctulonate synthase [Jhaorihella thermophila]|uniref:2-dehydro-3-deoxyphosphooctonate aldolase n=1 Tax=Jhaorihella thermophila TaxID=488547 RepID=A0A1H5X0V9_9RHOB|nr:3-deoxy-8-phosphooctulonate synthase [Jhaorihella thermophila]SEG05010.1 2-dehydro-3-deoxyphosphooctonate aldolase (KDO 8-P synthase) [Jhaorihella thermophila]